MAFALAALRPARRLRPEGPAGAGAAGGGGQRRGDRRLVGAAAVMRLPGAPAGRLPRRLAAPRGARRSASWRAASARRSTSTRAPRCARALAAYQRALAGRDHLVCYAMKANSNLAVLQTFAAAGCGFDIVSGGELERVLAAGGDPARDRLLRRRQDARRDGARARGRRAAASTSRARPSSSVLSRGRAARRPHARASACASIPTSTPAPIPTSRPACKRQQVRHRARATRSAAYRARRARCPGIEVVGIDCHIGSQITEIAPYLDALDRVLDLVEARRGATASPLHHLDLGGGLGITYTDETPPDADELVARAARSASTRAATATARSCSSRAARWSATPACCSARCSYLKPGETKNFCIVDAAMNDLVRPAMYDAWMRDRRRARAARRRAATLGRRRADLRVGRLARPRPRARRRSPATSLAVLSAGAYGMSMASNYNSRGRAPPR